MENKLSIPLLYLIPAICWVHPQGSVLLATFTSMYMYTYAGTTNDKQNHIYFIFDELHYNVGDPFQDQGMCRDLNCTCTSCMPLIQGLFCILCFTFYDVI